MNLNVPQILNRLHINDINDAYSTGNNWASSADAIIKTVLSPVDGNRIASVKMASISNYNHAVDVAADAFKKWRLLPAPKRGEIVREIGDSLRAKKEDLGKLVSYEMGKS